jgi:hypothetical protein
MFAALEDLYAEVAISVWETIRETIKISDKGKQGYYELRSISHGLMKHAQNYMLIGNKPNYTSYRSQVT